MKVELTIDRMKELPKGAVGEKARALVPGNIQSKGLFGSTQTVI